MSDNRQSEADWLTYVTGKMREIAESPAPRKRIQPKVTRHMSARQRAAFRMTQNEFRAGTMSAEEASEAWRFVAEADEDRTTREVGPGDKYNNVYSPGKETGHRTVDFNKEVQ